MIKKLLNLKLKFTKNQKGLTLIELLVVIVILGIIAAIAIPAVLGNRTDAAKGTNEQNAAIIQDAVNRYQAVTGSKPADGAELDKLLTATDTPGGPYIETYPAVEKFTDCGDTAFSYKSGKVTLSGKCLPADSAYKGS